MVLRQPTPGRPLRWEPVKPGDADVAQSTAHLLAAISLEVERNEEHSNPELCPVVGVAGPGDWMTGPATSGECSTA